MNVFVTGVGGFVARHLAAHLAAAGWTVAGSTSRPAAAAGVVRWRLGDPVDAGLFPFDRVDWVVHCAHDFTPGAQQTNVEGTRAMAAAARARGARQLFVSSLSARPDAESEYGRSKLAIEREFLDHGGLVVRPGTVLGDGGLFGRIAALMRRLPVVPLLDGGRAPLTVIGIHDLCRAMLAMLQTPPAETPAQINLYYARQPTFRELLEALRTVLERRVWLMPVPSWLLVPPLALCQAAGIRLPVNLENLKGYLKSRAPFHASDLGRFQREPESLVETLRSSLETGVRSPEQKTQSVRPT